MVGPSIVLKIYSLWPDYDIGKHIHYTLFDIQTGKEIFNLKNIRYDKKAGITRYDEIHVNTEKFEKLNGNINKKSHGQMVFNKELTRLLLLANSKNALCESNNPADILQNAIDFFKKGSLYRSITADMIKSFMNFCYDLIFYNPTLYHKFTREKKIEVQYERTKINLRYDKKSRGYSLFAKITEKENKTVLNATTTVPKLSAIVYCYWDAKLKTNKVDRNEDLEFNIKFHNTDIHEFDFSRWLNYFNELYSGRRLQYFARLCSSSLEVEYENKDIKSSLLITPEAGELSLRFYSRDTYKLNSLQFYFDVDKTVSMLRNGKLAVPSEVKVGGDEDKLIIDYTRFINKMESASSNITDDISL